MYKCLGAYRHIVTYYLPSGKEITVLWNEMKSSDEVILDITKLIVDWFDPKNAEKTEKCCVEKWVVNGLEESGMLFDYLIIEDPN